MRLRENFIAMPLFLRLMFLVFFLVPWWSLTFEPAPWIILRGAIHGPEILSLLTYWVGPLAICIAILARSIVFLPLLPAECLMVVINTLMFSAGHSGTLKALQLFLVVMMVILALALANRDFLFPFFTVRSRVWRKAPRLFSNARLHIVDGASNHLIVMEDCSLTGLAASGNAAALLPLFRGKKNAKLAITVKILNESYRFDAVVAWYRVIDHVVRFGLRVEDSHMLGQLMDSLPSTKSEGALQFHFDRFWARSSVRRTAISLWIVSFAGAYGIPACGTDPRHHRTFSAAQDDTRGESFQGFALDDDAGPKPRAGLAQSYYGRSLYKDCGSGEAAPLGKKWSQDAVMKMYSGNSTDWFESAMKSLEESDKNGVLRPRKAVHPMMWERLQGLKMGFWELTHVRFRFNGTYSIKLGYSANSLVGVPDPALQSLEMIHAIAIPDDRKEEFVHDVEDIPQDEARAGCEIDRILTKWLPDSSYWFLHTEVLDMWARGPIQWVFTEHLVFEGDADPVTTGCDDWTCGQPDSVFDPSGIVQGGMPQQVMQFKHDEKSFINDATTNACYDPKNPTDGLSKADCQARYRKWVGAQGSHPNGNSSGTRRLRLSPMKFPFYTYDAATDFAQADTSKQPIDYWFSGDLTNAQVSTITDLTGENLHPTSKTMRREAVFTCAGCHARTTVAPSDAPEGTMQYGYNMDFRFVSFGLHNPFNIVRWSVPSPYILASANSKGPNGFVNYEPMGGREKAVNKCSPFGGCTGCIDEMFPGMLGHQSYKWCLYDAAYLGAYHTADQPLKLTFPTIAQDAFAHAKQCVDDHNSGRVRPGACEFLRCVAFRAGSGMPIAQFSSVLQKTEADPTFGCEMDMSNSRSN